MSEHRVVCVGHLCGTWHDVDPEVRVRELKTELAQSRSTREGYLIARAEKGEAELRDYKVTLAVVRKMRTEAEARVADLEAVARDFIEWWDGGRDGNYWQAADRIRKIAREKEGD